ncbi:zinc finger protein 608 [Nerophis ophidion]|uniref:zinc finger protein 608 n=1 Tax=Nerophis ophidion TaxID=159077 RepID=UPI002AE04881|nr:zinc finger protein 608 [Nerophis ophidion]
MLTDGVLNTTSLCAAFRTPSSAPSRLRGEEEMISSSNNVNNNNSGGKEDRKENHVVRGWRRKEKRGDSCSPPSSSSSLLFLASSALQAQRLPDNTTLHLPRTPDNTTLHLPHTPDNTTLHLPHTPDNTTLHLPHTPDNTTLHLRHTPDNTTLHLPHTPDNTTLHLPHTPDNTTLHLPHTPDNTTLHLRHQLCGKSALDYGVRSSGGGEGGGGGGGGGGGEVVRRPHDDSKDKVEPMFTPTPPLPPPAALCPPTPPSCPRAKPRTRSVGTDTQDAGATSGPDGDWDSAGPCQPGTSINLEGMVWHETEEGVLVVNVRWRKRTYVGTLLDCTKHDWAPPRFCESPSSDPEMPCGRGRGKRMRLAMAERPCVEVAPAVKVRGLPQHRSRGGGMAASPVHSKGRRGSLKLISNCRTSPSFFTMEGGNAANGAAVLLSGKRKIKLPADLDLSLVSSDNITNGNGKRIRAKSRSAPSTPQGKSDPSFMDPERGGTSSPPPLPILIDCPHPNCTKRYKHINGLRYHQTHAHLEAEEPRKPYRDHVKDSESEERLSDCEESVSHMTYDLSEANNSLTKKAAPLYKVTTVGSPKNRRLLLSTDHSSPFISKTRRSSLLKDGLIDDLSNLPIISNMTVVLENCMVADRSSAIEMPKLEAEGLIDKKVLCDKNKTANGKVEKLSKSRTNRQIAPAPAPPKLIAIPNASYPGVPADAATSQQPSTIAEVVLSSKNVSLKAIKPKLSIVMEPSLVKDRLLGCKETRKTEKRRLKDKHGRDAPTRLPHGDDSGIKIEDGTAKISAKEICGSLLKEHLSKQEVMNGFSESQESRMASIRAEADKVYTFTDNAPSPSIGCSSRLDAGGSCLPTSDSKTNSPAYSDISDAGEDGVSSESRLDAIRSKSVSTAELNATSNHSNARRTPPAGPGPSLKEPQSPYYHSFEPYFLPGYVQADRHHDAKSKEEDNDSPRDFSDCKTGEGSAPSQLQLAMSQTQTALAQSLYYGQYSRGLYMDQKLLLATKCCEQKRGHGGREGEDVKHLGGTSSSEVKCPEGAKGCCPKAILTYLEVNEQGERGLAVKVVSTKDCDDIHSASTMSQHNHNSHSELDSNLSYSSPSDGPTWAQPMVHSKYSELQSPLGEGANEEDAERSKERGTTMEAAGPMSPMARGGGGGGYDAKKPIVPGSQDVTLVDSEDSDGLDGLQEPVGTLLGESQSARVAISPPLTPQQPYMQYQHSSYPPYLAMCESDEGSYRGVSPTLVHNYTGFPYPLYGKTAGREESEVTLPCRGGVVSGKQGRDSSSSSTMELLKQCHQFHGKSPAAGEKCSPEVEHGMDRERSRVSLGRHLHTHHHTHLGVSYNLLSGQYNIYPGLSSRSLVSGQQASGRSSADSDVKK